MIEPFTIILRNLQQIKLMVGGLVFSFISTFVKYVMAIHIEVNNGVKFNNIKKKLIR